MTQPSDKALDLIKQFEGCRLKAYKCPAGVWTIGWGTTRIQGKPVRPGLRITQAEADLLLRLDAEQHWRSASRYVDVQLTQNQIDALASFVFNVGVGAFSESDLLQHLNAGRFNDAANEFDRWTKARKGRTKVVLPGLVKRRAAEKALYLS